MPSRPTDRPVDRTVSLPVDEAWRGGSRSVFAGRPNGVGYATAGDKFDVTGTALTIRFRARDYTNGSNLYFVSKMNPGVTAGYAIAARPNGIRILIGDGTAVPYEIVLPSPDPGVERAIAARFSGTRLDIWVDGVIQGFGLPTANPIASAVGNDFNIGAFSTGSNQLANTIRDLRVDNFSLPESRIIGWTNREIDDVGLICDFPINEGQGNILNNRTPGGDVATLTGITPAEFWVPIT